METPLIDIEHLKKEQMLYSELAIKCDLLLRAICDMQLKDAKIRSLETTLKETDKANQ